METELVFVVHTFEPDQSLIVPFVCQRCASSCCTKLSPTFTKDELIRVCDKLNFDFESFKSSYVISEVSGAFRLKKPCPFVKDGNVCTIYEDRPKGCRYFPFSEVYWSKCIGLRKLKNLLLELCSGFSYYIEKRIFPDPRTNETMYDYLKTLPPLGGLLLKRIKQKQKQNVEYEFIFNELIYDWI